MLNRIEEKKGSPDNELFLLMLRQTNAIILPFSEMQNILLQTVGK